jgi:hypothetical protein
MLATEKEFRFICEFLCEIATQPSTIFWGNFACRTWLSICTIRELGNSMLQSLAAFSKGVEIVILGFESLSNVSKCSRAPNPIKKLQNDHFNIFF